MTTSNLRLFTSESVTEGHPDKICDQISDTILDALLEVDPHARVAVETMVTTGLVHVAGEVTTSGYVEIPKLVRDVITGIGYDSSEVSFDGRTCGVEVSIGAQSPDIAQGVDESLDSRSGAGVDPLDRQGAGDQGIMFGFATNETPEYMPVAIWLAHRLAERLAAVRKSGELPYLRPDGKTQVTVGYHGVVPKTVETVVLSTQHAPEITYDELRADARSAVRELLADPGREQRLVALVRDRLGPDAQVRPHPSGGVVGQAPDGRRVDASVDALVEQALAGIDLDPLWTVR